MLQETFSCTSLEIPTGPLEQGGGSLWASLLTQGPGRRNSHQDPQRWEKGFIRSSSFLAPIVCQQSSGANRPQWETLLSTIQKPLKGCYTRLQPHIRRMWAVLQRREAVGDSHICAPGNLERDIDSSLSSPAMVKGHSWAWQEAHLFMLPKPDLQTSVLPMEPETTLAWVPASLSHSSGQSSPCRDSHSDKTTSPCLRSQLCI